jgi:5-methylcytosine-specific restriction endonuclease McrA
VLRFEVAADTFATFREAMQRLQRLAGGTLDDDAVLLAMARHVLGGPRDDGRSSYQVALSVCGACGAGVQRAAGELLPIDAAVVAMAACDAQHLAEFLPRSVELRAANENAGLDADATAGAELGAHETPAVPSRDESSATRQTSDHAHVDAQSRRVSDAAASTTPPTQRARADAQPSPRAKQSVPPALRRTVLTRERHRCRVPRCAHATFVDVHHVQPRSEGGRHEASNLLTLCSAHHRATHRGELLIEREHEEAFTFRHADGAAYGSPILPRLVDMHAKVFAALRHLGFREGEVKGVLAELRGDAELGGASVEHLLREALRRIRRTAR